MSNAEEREGSNPAPDGISPSVEAQSSGGVTRGASPMSDPFVRRALWLSGALVTLFLVTVVSALVMGLATPEAPRTSAERALRITELTAMQNPEDPEAWGAYLRALVQSGQILQAQSLIDQLGGVVDQSGTEEVSFYQAAVYQESGRYDDAISTAEELRSRLRAHHEQRKQTPDTPESRGEPIHDNYWLALIIIAESHASRGNLDEAIRALDTYLAEKETAADALIRRGYLRERNGDIAGAEADYRAALVYMPDDPAVLEHLERIGAQ